KCGLADIFLDLHLLGNYLGDEYGKVTLQQLRLHHKKITDRVVGLAGIVESSVVEAANAFGEQVYCLNEAIRAVHATSENINSACEALRAEVKAQAERADFLEERLADRVIEHNPTNPEVRAKVLAMTDGRCAYCNCEISPGKDDGKPEFVVEHVVPKSVGGPDHLHNYVPSCPSCNSSKHAGHVIEFIRRRVA
ncbi:MAG: HNH endonuclease, partial [Betaproteobacteria bacterium]